MVTKGDVNDALRAGAPFVRTNHHAQIVFLPAICETRVMTRHLRLSHPVLRQ